MKKFLGYLLLLSSGLVCYAQVQPLSKTYVSWYGARGDAVTDDSVAFQRAIDATLNHRWNANAGGKILRISDGVYNIATGLNLCHTNHTLFPGEGFTLEGEGEGTILSYSGTNNLFEILGTTHVTLRNMKLTTSATTGYGRCAILFGRYSDATPVGQYFQMENVHITGAWHTCPLYNVGGAEDVLLKSVLVEQFADAPVFVSARTNILNAVPSYGATFISSTYGATACRMFDTEFFPAVYTTNATVIFQGNQGWSIFGGAIFRYGDKPAAVEFWPDVTGSFLGPCNFFGTHFENVLQPNQGVPVFLLRTYGTTADQNFTKIAVRDCSFVNQHDSTNGLKMLEYTNTTGATTLTLRDSSFDTPVSDYSVYQLNVHVPIVDNCTFRLGLGTYSQTEAYSYTARSTISANTISTVGANIDTHIYKNSTSIPTTTGNFVGQIVYSKNGTASLLSEETGWRWNGTIWMPLQKTDVRFSAGTPYNSIYGITSGTLAYKTNGAGGFSPTYVNTTNNSLGWVPIPLVSATAKEGSSDLIMDLLSDQPVQYFTNVTGHLSVRLPASTAGVSPLLAPGTFSIIGHAGGTGYISVYDDSIRLLAELGTGSFGHFVTVKYPSGDIRWKLIGISSSTSSSLAVTNDVIMSNGTTNRMVFSGGILISNIGSFYP